MKKLIVGAMVLMLLVSLAGSALAQKMGHEPDFTNPSAVIADLERMKKEGEAKKAQMVVIKCNYAMTTIKNFIRLNPGGDPSILKQRWQEAYNEYKKIM
jgi:hypothetical protein